MPQIFDSTPNLQQSQLTEITAQGLNIAAQTTSLGNINDAAATSDTQATGLIGLVKRLLQRLTILITSVGNLDTNLGSRADISATSDSGTFSLISLIKRGLSTLTSIAANTATGSQVPASTSTTTTISIAANTSSTIFSSVTGVKVSDIILLNVGTTAIDICYAATATAATKITTLQPGKGWTHNYSGPVSAISTSAATLQSTRVTG